MPLDLWISVKRMDLMPAMHISRSIEIDVPVDVVYESISNFREWPRWSPWLIAEPGCEVTYAEDGTSYSWDGQYVGAGEMKIAEEKKNEALHCDLQFFKPWKSTAKVAFLLEPASESTRVSWKMDSSLPVFMFFMKDMMEGFVGMDYQRGLAMLKDLLETGDVPVKLEFGEEVVGPFSLIGIRTECTIDGISKAMGSDTERLCGWLKESGASPSDKMRSVYHKWSPAKNLVCYTVGFPFTELPTDLPEKFVTLEVPWVTAFTSQITGPYRHIGNAWSAGIVRSRNGAFKQSRKVHPFEVYGNSLEEVDENDLVTTVYFPMR